MKTFLKPLAALPTAMLLSPFQPLVAPPTPPGPRTQTFENDPGWDGYRNRLKPDSPGITRQDFGLRTSNHFANQSASEIGGWAQRSATPAFFAKAISPKTLADRLSASGQFVVTKSQGSSGMLFGWFNQISRGWQEI